MIDRISKELASFLVRNGSDESCEVLSYAFANILNIIFITFTTLAIGSISGRFFETLVSLIGFATIRHFSGGLHMRSMDWCYVVSTLIIVVPPHVELSYAGILAMTLLSVICYGVFAPNITEELANKKDKDNKLRDKLISIFIVSANLYLQSSTLAVVFLIQAVLILPYLNQKKGGA